jgi:uncharacterized damage-inducible protein DinB
MKISDILLLYDYNDWANQRILDTAVQVSPEQFVAPTGHCFGSLRGTLVHMLGGEYAWRRLWQHQTLAYFGTFKEEEFPTLEVLRQRWAEEERALREYLVSLTDEDLVGYVRYTTPEGAKRERVLWHCLVHLVNHGTQHRSEAADILTRYAFSPGDLDFTLFLNERG